MKIFRFLVTTSLVCLISFTVQAESEFFKKFKKDYGELDIDLLSLIGEIGSVTNFVYQKDLATFTFSEGRFYLMRPIQGRPTTALFIGKGSAHMEIPSHVERQSLLYASRDSLVDESFDVCLIRTSDDLDLKLRAATTFETKQLDWKDYNIVKKAQGEFFFRPVIQHEYDNHFQLLRSVYERSLDGFFFIDFNRYGFTYDPNRPERVIVAYEREGGAATLTEGAVLQEKERGLRDDAKMGEIPFPTTMIEGHGELNMGGMDGYTIESGLAQVKIVVNQDSMKFLSLFLHYNLKLDSILVGGVPADFMRRKDFNFIGVILPDYHRKSDTLIMKLFLHGRDYLAVMPYVENPSPAKLSFVITAPKEFSYLMPGIGQPEAVDGRRNRFTVELDQPYREFEFQSYGPGYDTVSATTDVGMTLNFLKSKSITKERFECFIPDEKYRPAAIGAFDFLAARLGSPPGVFGISVFPEGKRSMPGLVEIPQVRCLRDGTGAHQIDPGYQMARQWFGATVRPASYREYWLAAVVPEYLSIFYVQAALGGGPFYSELALRRDNLHTAQERDRDLPLATGPRVNDSMLMAKGAWMMHMLRYVMYDLDKQSDQVFVKFLRELAYLANNRVFSNADVIALAEKVAEKPLGWFFDHWLFGRGIPEYNVSYSFIPKGTQYAIAVTVTTSGVEQSYTMPVIMRVEGADGKSTYYRQTLKSGQESFELGPMPEKPKAFYFNEFMSVLSYDKVKGK